MELHTVECGSEENTQLTSIHYLSQNVMPTEQTSHPGSLESLQLASLEMLCVDAQKQQILHFPRKENSPGRYCMKLLPPQMFPMARRQHQKLFRHSKGRQNPTSFSHEPMPASEYHLKTLTITDYHLVHISTYLIRTCVLLLLQQILSATDCATERTNKP